MNPLLRIEPVLLDAVGGVEVVSFFNFGIQLFLKVSVNISKKIHAIILIFKVVLIFFVVLL